MPPKKKEEKKEPLPPKATRHFPLPELPPGIELLGGGAPPPAAAAVAPAAAASQERKRFFCDVAPARFIWRYGESPDPKEVPVDPALYLPALNKWLLKKMPTPFEDQTDFKLPEAFAKQISSWKRMGECAQLGGSTPMIAEDFQEPSEEERFFTTRVSSTTLEVDDASKLCRLLANTFGLCRDYFFNNNFQRFGSRAKTGKEHGNEVIDNEGEGGEAAEQQGQQQEQQPLPERKLWDCIYPQEGGRPMINPEGKYGVKLFVNGEWWFVVIDDRIPVDSENFPILPRSNDPLEMYPLILSKAILKILDGNFQLAEIDLSNFVIQALAQYSAAVYPTNAVDTTGILSWISSASQESSAPNMANNLSAPIAVLWGALPITEGDSEADDLKKKEEGIGGEEEEKKPTALGHAAHVLQSFDQTESIGETAVFCVKTTQMRWDAPKSAWHELDRRLREEEIAREDALLQESMQQQQHHLSAKATDEVEEADGTADIIAEGEERNNSVEYDSPDDNYVPQMPPRKKKIKKEVQRWVEIPATTWSAEIAPHDVPAIMSHLILFSPLGANFAKSAATDASGASIGMYARNESESDEAMIVTLCSIERGDNGSIQRLSWSSTQADNSKLSLSAASPLSTAIINLQKGENLFRIRLPPVPCVVLASRPHKKYDAEDYVAPKPNIFFGEETSLLQTAGSEIKTHVLEGKCADQQAFVDYVWTRQRLTVSSPCYVGCSLSVNHPLLSLSAEITLVNLDDMSVATSKLPIFAPRLIGPNENGYVVICHSNSPGYVPEGSMYRLVVYFHGADLTLTEIPSTNITDLDTWYSPNFTKTMFRINIPSSPTVPLASIFISTFAPASFRVKIVDARGCETQPETSSSVLLSYDASNTFAIPALLLPPDSPEIQHKYVLLGMLMDCMEIPQEDIKEGEKVQKWPFIQIRAISDSPAAITANKEKEDHISKTFSSWEEGKAGRSQKAHAIRAYRLDPLSNPHPDTVVIDDGSKDAKGKPKDPKAAAAAKAKQGQADSSVEEVNKYGFADYDYRKTAPPKMPTPVCASGVAATTRIAPEALEAAKEKFKQLRDDASSFKEDVAARREKDRMDRAAAIESEEAHLQTEPEETEEKTLIEKRTQLVQLLAQLSSYVTLFDRSLSLLNVAPMKDNDLEVDQSNVNRLNAFLKAVDAEIKSRLPSAVEEAMNATIASQSNPNLESADIVDTAAAATVQTGASSTNRPPSQSTNRPPSQSANRAPSQADLRPESSLSASIQQNNLEEQAEASEEETTSTYQELWKTAIAGLSGMWAPPEGQPEPKAKGKAAVVEPVDPQHPSAEALFSHKRDQIERIVRANHSRIVAAASELAVSLAAEKKRREENPEPVKGKAGAKKK